MNKVKHFHFIFNTHRCLSSSTYLFLLKGATHLLSWVLDADPASLGRANHPMKYRFSPWT